MSAKKTPRRLISDYLDASKTQMDSHPRRQARSIPRTPDTVSQSVERVLPHSRVASGTPDTVSQSVKRVLPHSRVASLRSKRRSVSAFDEEDTPRTLISQFLATAETSTPLVRHGRRTSQSGVFASQPALPVSNKRRRRSSPLDDMSIASETPRTLINRYLQNVSQTVETPVVRHHSTLPPVSPENPLVHDSYNTPSPFRESSAGSVSSVRKSARKLVRLSRSATKSNYSLVIPESQGFSSPSTDKLGTQHEFHMPSPFQSSDTEDEEGDMPVPDRSRYNRTRHAQGGYNLIVPESMLEGTQQRDQSIHEAMKRHRDQSMYGEQRSLGDQSVFDHTASHRDHPEYQETDVHRDSSLIYNNGIQREQLLSNSSVRYRDQAVYDDEDRQEMEDEDRQEMEEEEEGRELTRQEEYKLYELPLQEPDNESYENIFRVSDSSLSHQGQQFSAKLLSLSHRSDREILEEEVDEEEEDEEVTRQSLSRRSSHTHSMRNNQSATVRVTPNHLSLSRQMSPMLDFNRRSPSTRRAHSFGATGSPVSHARSPRRSEPQPGHQVMTESSPIVSGRLYQRGHQGQEHIHSIAEQFSPRISSTQRTMNTEPLTREHSPIGTVTPSPVVSPDRDSLGATPKSSGRRSMTPRSGSKQDYTGTPRSITRSRSNVMTPADQGRTVVTRNLQSYINEADHSEMIKEFRSSGVTPPVSVTRSGTKSTPRPASQASNRSTSSTPRSADMSASRPAARSSNRSASSTPRSGTKSTPRPASRASNRSTPRSAAMSVSRASNRSVSSTPRNTTQSTSSKVLTDRPSGTTTSRTPSSKVATPSSANQKSARRSIRSPVVAGRMGRHHNKDLVHTLPNLTSSFSPPIASTQNPVSISPLTPEHKQFDVPEDEENPRDYDRDKENESHMINPAEEEEEWQDVEVEAATSRQEERNKRDSPSQKLPKVTRKPRKQDPYGIPINLVKKRISHYAGMRFDKDAVKCVMDISEKYWDNLAADLSAYAKHAGRKRINMDDIVLLFKRQGHVSEKQSLNSLIEKYMPYEWREKLIPCARAFNKVELNRKAI